MTNNNLIFFRLSRFDIVLTTYNIVAMEAKSLIQKDQKDEEKVLTRCHQKMYLTLTLYFETVTTIIFGILAFPISPDLCNSFDTLPICFHDLINRWQ